MSWLNPWAFAGVLALALPLLIHLLGRGTARVKRFPTLRFVEPSRLLPTRRTRLHDVLLLAVRLAVLAAAVAALAHPLLVTASRRATLDASLSRVVIVDTSASMRRVTTDGAQGFSAAFREAEKLAAEAQSSVIVPSAMPVGAIAGAGEWLRKQSGQTELVIVSDFQLGMLDSLDLAAVEAGSGIRLVRIDAPATATTDLPDRAASQVRVLAGTGERGDMADLLRAVARVTAVLPVDSSRHVAVVLPGFEGRTALLRASSTISTPWMGVAAARLRSDSVLAAATENARVRSAADSSAALVIARNSAGAPTVIASAGRVDGVDHLLLWPLTDAATLTSAALIAAAQRLVSIGTPAAERETALLDERVLRRWERSPATSALARANVDRDKAPSDARWFWLLALLLLGAEALLRRPSRVAPTKDEARAAAR